MNQQALLALTYTTPGASSATVSTTGSTSPASASASASATQTSSPPAASKAPGLSGAAIGSIVGGVVGGVVGGLALLGVLGFFLWRRKRNNTKAVAAPPATSDPYQPYGYQPSNQPPPNEAYSPQPPLDKYAHYQMPVEAPTNHEPAEMDASYYQQPHHGK
jgi:MYXO-CTERM domain-containing protein